MKETKKRKIEKEFYKHFCDVILESIRPIGKSVEWVYKRIEFKNSTLIEELQKQHKLLILLAGHYAAWELTPTVSQFSCWPVHPLYTPIRNNAIAKIVHETRTKLGSELISRYEFAKHIISKQNKKLGGLYIVVSDQSPRIKDKGLITTFLNQMIPIHNGAERISRMLNIPVVYLAISRKKRGFYQAEFQLITDSPTLLPKDDITKTFIQFLQQQIHTDPSQYLWTHNRFKHARNQTSS